MAPPTELNDTLNNNNLAIFPSISVRWKRIFSPSSANSGFQAVLHVKQLVRENKIHLKTLEIYF